MNSFRKKSIFRDEFKILNQSQIILKVVHFCTMYIGCTDTGDALYRYRWFSALVQVMPFTGTGDVLLVQVIHNADIGYELY